MSSPITFDKVGEYVIHHLLNSTHWSPLPGVHLKLPAILTPYSAQLDFGLTFHLLMLLFVAGLMLFLFVGVFKRRVNEAPRGITNVLEYLVVFVRDEISIKNLGEETGRKFTPFFLTLFFMIFLLNYLSLIPFFGTATANINVTSAFAIMIMVIMLVGGFAANGLLGFFKLFIPPGLPGFLKGPIFVLELMSFPIRIFALTLRLFGNMLGGHMVIGVLVGMIIVLKPWGFLISPLIFFVYLLEFVVAFIQAYIFCLLSTIFIGQMLHPEH